MWVVVGRWIVGGNRGGDGGGCGRWILVHLEYRDP